MELLIGCEYSGIVRNAFIKAGHNAISCDLLPGSPGGPHWQCDIFEAINSKKWDGAVFFPPCTYLCRAQIPAMVNSKARMLKSLHALKFVTDLYHCNIPLVAIENPIGLLSSSFRPPDQIVYPWWFGDKHSKDICLWLKGLPPLMAGAKHWGRVPVSNHVNGQMSQDLKSHIKSRFFPAVAKAMSNQWFI